VPALTRNYVEDDCVESYGSGRVAYARDAFDGLSLMDKVKTNGFDDYLAAIQKRPRGQAVQPRSASWASPRRRAAG